MFHLVPSDIAILLEKRPEGQELAYWVQPQHPRKLAQLLKQARVRTKKLRQQGSQQNRQGLCREAEEIWDWHINAAQTISRCANLDDALFDKLSEQLAFLPALLENPHVPETWWGRYQRSRLQDLRAQQPDTYAFQTLQVLARFEKLTPGTVHELLAYLGQWPPDAPSFRLLVQTLLAHPGLADSSLQQIIDQLKTSEQLNSTRLKLALAEHPAAHEKIWEQLYRTAASEKLETLRLGNRISGHPRAGQSAKVRRAFRLWGTGGQLGRLGRTVEARTLPEIVQSLLERQNSWELDKLLDARLSDLPGPQKVARLWQQLLTYPDLDIRRRVLRELGRRTG